MVGRVVARPCTPHLTSALIACAITCGILFGGRVLAIHLESKTIHETAPRDFWIKNQGLAFQRAAAHAPDILLLYGSSELIDPIPNRASDFFSSEPSGFQVCPVGKGGATSLNILQKLAALGSDLRGRKIAVWVSPSSFFKPDVKLELYAGNFSWAAASGTLFGNSLDFELKSEIARRMLQFPDTLAKAPLLQLAATSLASGEVVDRMVLMAIWPLGKLQNLILDLQDHFAALVYIFSGDRSTIPKRELRRFELSSHSAPDNTRHRLRELVSPGALSNSGPELVQTHTLEARDFNRDAAFRARIATANEWTDLELLLRTAAEIGAHPLVVSMPIDTTRDDLRGVSRLGRQVYYDGMSELARRYHFPLVQFEDHDGDSTFLIAHREHPTAKGWQYYDRALADFFHQSL
jgi:D-alanine transfer protein